MHEYVGRKGKHWHRHGVTMKTKYNVKQMVWVFTEINSESPSDSLPLAR